MPTPRVFVELAEALAADSAAADAADARQPAARSSSDAVHLSSSSPDLARPARPGRWSPLPTYASSHDRPPALSSPHVHLHPSRLASHDTPSQSSLGSSVNDSQSARLSLAPSLRSVSSQATGGSAAGAKLAPSATPSIAAKLPKYNGPFKVGVVDIETAPTETVSKGLLVRIYYPAVAKSLAKKAPWLPKTVMYALGYGDFLGVPRAVTLGFLAPAFGSIHMPARIGSRLHHASSSPPLPERLPVVVFSHGLAGMRTTYSTLCGCLAAKGFVVIAPEHGDGSGSATARNAYKTRIPYVRSEDNRLGEDEALDMRLKDMRNDQVEYRTNEVFAAVELLRNLDAGQFDSRKDNIMHTFCGGFDFRQFAGRLDLDNMAIVGHSFGGATAITALSRPNHPFACGVMLDPWMFPVKDPNVTVPFLTIQSETFHWRQNLEEILAMLRSDATHSSSRFGHVKGTAHSDCCDFATLYTKMTRRMRQAGGGDPYHSQLVLDEWITEYLCTFLDVSGLDIPQYAAFAVDGPMPGVTVPEVAVFGEESIAALQAGLVK
ncbi:hypothetical protein HK105_204293 [Polyrhizophydium stewartii]|uniref:1-alkyl-2-acetylglycerophosphocholine esterase n=1 Tax=Polyrhizophydium stewartii TaxID=2732419 RepID=A0ABR4N9N0_9FUNG